MIGAFHSVDDVVFDDERTIGITIALEHGRGIGTRLQKQAEAIRAELGDVRKTGTDQRTINLVAPQER